MKTVYGIWYEGKKRREDLTIRDFERMIEKGAFNEGGIKFSQFNQTLNIVMLTLCRWRIEPKPHY